MNGKDHYVKRFTRGRLIRLGRIDHHGKGFRYRAYRMGDGSTLVDFSRIETPDELLFQWNEEATVAQIIQWAKEEGDLD